MTTPRPLRRPARLPARARRPRGAAAVVALLAVLGLVAGACSSTGGSSTATSGGVTTSSPGTGAAPGTTVGTTPGTTVGTTPGSVAPDEAVAMAATTFVGTIEDSALAVAAVVQGERVLLYVCDGATGARIGGAIGDDGLFRTDLEGVGPLTLSVTADEISGTLAVAGVGKAVSVAPAVGSAGLYWATGAAPDGVAVKVGWIVQNDGSETGGLVTSISDGTSNTAVPLPSGAITDGTSNTIVVTGPSPALVANRATFIEPLVATRKPLTSIP